MDNNFELNFKYPSFGNDFVNYNENIDIKALFDSAYDNYRQIKYYNEQTRESVNINNNLTNFQLDKNRYIEERDKFIDEIEKSRFNLLDNLGRVSRNKLLYFTTCERLSLEYLKNGRISKDEALRNVEYFENGLQNFNRVDVEACKNGVAKSVSLREPQIHSTPIYNGQFKNPISRNIVNNTGYSQIPNDNLESNTINNVSNDARNSESIENNDFDPKTKNENNHNANKKGKKFSRDLKTIILASAISASAVTGAIHHYTVVNDKVIETVKDAENEAKFNAHHLIDSPMFGGNGVYNSLDNVDPEYKEVYDLYEEKGNKGLSDYLDSELNSGKALSTDELNQTTKYMEVYQKSTLQEALLYKSNNLVNNLTTSHYFDTNIDNNLTPDSIAFADYSKNEFDKGALIQDPPYKCNVYNQFGQVVISFNIKDNVTNNYISDMENYSSKVSKDIKDINDTTTEGVENKLEFQKGAKYATKYIEAYNKYENAKYKGNDNSKISEAKDVLENARKEFKSYNNLEQEKEH